MQRNTAAGLLLSRPEREGGINPAGSTAKDWFICNTRSDLPASWQLLERLEHHLID